MIFDYFDDLQDQTFIGPRFDPTKTFQMVAVGFDGCGKKDSVTSHKVSLKDKFLNLLTEVAGEGGPDLAPQKFLLSQKFRHLMG